MSRFIEALRWLAARGAADRDDFREEFKRGADDLRDGLVAQGYARHAKRVDRYAVMDAGFRRLEVAGG